MTNPTDLGQDGHLLEQSTHGDIAVSTHFSPEDKLKHPYIGHGAV